MSRQCRIPPRRYLDSELRQAAALEGPDQALHAVDGPRNLGGGRRGKLHLGVVPERGQARLRVRDGGCGKGSERTVFSQRREPGLLPLPSAPRPIPSPGLPPARCRSPHHSPPHGNPAPSPCPAPPLTADQLRPALHQPLHQPLRGLGHCCALNVTAAHRTGDRHGQPAARTPGHVGGAGLRRGRGGAAPDPRVRDPRRAQTAPVFAPSPNTLFRAPGTARLPAPAVR